MGQLADIEDALLARAAALLGTTLRAYQPLPGGLAQLADLLALKTVPAPCLYVQWRGGERPEHQAGGRTSGPAGPGLRSLYSLIAVTQHPAPEQEARRRRGDGHLVIGAYDIAERLGAGLHDWTLPGVGTCTLVHLGPIEGQALTDLGTTLLEVRLALPHDLGMGLDLSGLDDFLHFEGTLDQAPPDGVADVTVTLERAADESFV